MTTTTTPTTPTTHPAAVSVRGLRESYGDHEVLASVDLEGAPERLPAFERLLELMEERGWTGWTQITRLDSGPAAG